MVKAANLKPGQKIIVDGDVEIVAYTIGQTGDVRIVFVGGREIVSHWNRAFKLV